MYDVNDLARVIQHQQQQINWLINKVNQLEQQLKEDSLHLYQKTQDIDASLNQRICMHQE